MKKIKWVGLAAILCLGVLFLGLRTIGGSGMLFLDAASPATQMVEEFSIPLLRDVPLATQTLEAPAGMAKVAENAYLTLYLNEEDTSLAIMDNATGKLWYTNPVNADKDGIANNHYIRMMKSQLQVQYYNTKAQVSSMNNYNDSIINGQFEFTYLPDGVQIAYTMGKLEEDLLLPEAISEERFLYFTGQMGESDAKKVGRYYKLLDVSGDLTIVEKEYLTTYPGYGGENFYVMRSNVGSYMQQQLAVLFAGAGYTLEEYKADKEESGLEEEDENAWFTIPLTYRLEGENLVVSIDPEAVTYNENGFYLVNIDVLPYFVAASDADGYLFVPDGSGALMYLDSGKNSSTYSTYYGVVYGVDESTRLMSTTKSAVDVSYTVKLPVFGIKADDQALFAIIEEGAGYAGISADVAGRTSSYSNVYAGFSYLQYGAASLTDRLATTSGYNLYSNGDFTGIYQIRYAFLTGEKANYSGMAAYYRNYLEEQGVLTRSEENTKLPLYTEYIGAIDRYKTFLGFRYSATESLTTFAQAEKIVQQLMDLGVENQVMVYSGWMNGGLHGTAATKTKVVGSLEKGGVTLKKLQADMKKLGIDTFMTVDLQYVYKDKLFDGYASQQYSPNYFDHTEITAKSYYMSDGYEMDTLANLISPYYVDKVAGSLAKSASKYQLSGLNLGSACWYLYSDFLPKRYTDRQAAIGLYEDSFAALGESVNKLLGDNGNSYSFSYVDYMLNAPLYTNKYRILDAEVPFYEMVLHGYIPYSGEALNLTDDYQTTLLKCVESGAGLLYKWIYGENSLLKETDYDYLYSVYYGSWIDTAVQDYKRVAEAMEGLGNQLIVQHKILDGNVTKTVYEDGTEIYVNYGFDAVECEGVTVGAMDFTVRKGGE